MLTDLIPRMQMSGGAEATMQIGNKNKSWVFTWNGANTDDYLDHVGKMEELREKPIYRRLIAAHEVAPSTGTKHIQGAIIFRDSHSKTYVRNLMPGAYVEKMQGNWGQQIEYCSKECDVFIHEVRPYYQRFRIGTSIQMYCCDCLQDYTKYDAYFWRYIGQIPSGEEN